MNPVLESLRSAIETDPLPAAYTSSHWRQHGQDTVVEYGEAALRLEASGFPRWARPGIGGRLLSVAERWSYRRVTARLHTFPTIWSLTKRLLRDLQGGPDFHALKSAYALATLADHWAASQLSPKVFALIGDGDGFFGALLRRYLAEIRIYCIDLPKILVFQAHTHGLADPRAAMSLFPAQHRTEKGGEIIFVFPQDIERIPEAIDCAVNIASMQEMNAFTIASYFAFLRRRSTPRSRFYCVNRLRKELVGGEVAHFSRYPWRSDDEVFLDGPCPYYTHFFSSETSPNGPRVFGRRVPSVNHFDGPTVHRLARLAPEP